MTRLVKKKTNHLKAKQAFKLVSRSASNKTAKIVTKHQKKTKSTTKSLKSKVVNRQATAPKLKTVKIIAKKATSKAVKKTLPAPALKVITKEAPVAPIVASDLNIQSSNNQNLKIAADEFLITETDVSNFNDLQPIISVDYFQPTDHKQIDNTIPEVKTSQLIKITLNDDLGVVSQHSQTQNINTANLVNLKTNSLPSIKVNQVPSQITSELVNTPEKRTNNWLKQTKFDLPPKKSFWTKSKNKTNLNFTTRSKYLDRFSLVLNFSLVALLVILPIRGLYYYQNLKSAKQQVLGVSEQAFSDLISGVKAATDSDWQTANDKFSQAENLFTEAESALNQSNQTLLDILKQAPIVGDKINSGESLLLAGQKISNSSQLLVKSLSGLSDNKNDLSKLDLPLLKNDINKIQTELLEAIDLLASVDETVLPRDKQTKLATVKEALPQIRQNLLKIDQLLNFLIDVLGYDQTKRYLFIFQNSNELRATGGFMGSFALTDIKNGKIIKQEVPGGGFYDLKGSFLKKIISPFPMHLVGTAWGIWDANWWFDFPTSAKKIQQFMEMANWPTVDGVVSFNSNLIPKLIEQTGPITLDKYNKVLDKDNVVLALQHAVEFEYDKTKNQPKEIIGDLMPILTERLLQTRGNKIGPLLFNIFDSLSSKDIQFYFRDEKLQKFTMENNWSGEVQTTEGDYLAVVNQNIAGGKTDGVIEQKIDLYTEVLDNGSIENTVTITRSHHGKPNDVFERVNNVTYLRVYLPLGSKLIETTGYQKPDSSLFKPVMPGYSEDSDLSSQQVYFDPVSDTAIFQESGKTVFGNWIQVEPGQTSKLSFSYILPFKLDLDSGTWLKNSLASYSCLIQKQSGIVSLFKHQFRLPNNTKVVWHDSANLNAWQLHENEVDYALPLNSDTDWAMLVTTK